MNNDVELIPVKGVLPSVQVQLDNVIYVPQAHKNKAGIVKEGDGVLIENGVVSLNKQTVEDMIDANKWVSYGFRQNLTKEEKGMARHNIGAGDNDFTGSYYDVTQKPHLNTNNTAGLDYGDEELNDTINLHKISKTGSFNDLKHVPQETLDFAESERQKSKNLCCLKNESATVAGVTVFYDSKNQTIELNGTSTGDINIMPNIRNILPIISNSLGKTYSFTIFIESGNFSENFSAYLGSLDSDFWSDRFTTWVNKGSTSSSVTFTASTNHTYDTLSVYLLKGTVVNNLKLKVQIEEGSVATDYQPYNGEIVHEKQISGLSNPNLLINGDFRVNQRGQTSYTTLGYTVDRWRTATEGTTVDVLDKGVRLNGTSSNNYNFYQFIEDYKSLAGKIITFSLKFTNNTDRIRLRINDGVGNTGSVYSTDTSGILTVTRTIADSPTQLRCIVQLETTGSSMSVDVIEAKLEIGSIATLFSPRPYAEELAMCQRYYQNCRINIAVLANTATALYPNIPLIQTLRTNPTVTITTMPSLRGNGSGIDVFTISSITFNNLKDNSIQLLCTVDASTPVQSNYVYQLVNGSCTFDAEIY